MDSEIKEIKIENMVCFKYHSGQTYESERLQQLMDSIANVGLLCPAIVRPVDNGKYEIICGHNRVKAVKALGYSTIKADVRYRLSDDMATELFFDSNLNQQTFSDWNYSQKFAAIKYLEQVCQKNSRQGKRTDLEPESSTDTEEGTCVQSRHKLKMDSKRTKTRDKMAKRLGISTATFGTYRRIIKLRDDLLQSAEQLLDEKRITLKAAYIIANVRNAEIKYLLERMRKKPELIIDMDGLKNLPTKKDEKPGVIIPFSKKRVSAALKLPPSSGILTPVRKKK